jgi:hypothetical protein
MRWLSASWLSGSRSRIVPRGLPTVSHEPHRQRQLPEGVGQLGQAAAVEVAGGDDLVPGREQSHEGDELCGHPAGGRDGTGRPFEGGQPLLEHRCGRIADPGVDVPVLLEFEELGGRLGVVEDERGGLIDGDRPGSDHRVGDVAGVKHPGVEAEAAGGRLSHLGGWLKEGPA